MRYLISISVLVLATLTLAACYEDDYYYPSHHYYSTRSVVTRYYAPSSPYAGYPRPAPRYHSSLSSPRPYAYGEAYSAPQRSSRAAAVPQARYQSSASSQVRVRAEEDNGDSVAYAVPVDRNAPGNYRSSQSNNAAPASRYRSSQQR